MEKQYLSIKGIPAVLWGSASDNFMIAAHGNQSHKKDHVIVILAEEAAKKGYRTLSFDLPEHGDRKEEARLCNDCNNIQLLEPVFIATKTRLGSYISAILC